MQRPCPRSAPSPSMVNGRYSKAGNGRPPCARSRQLGSRSQAPIRSHPTRSPSWQQATAVKRTETHPHSGVVPPPLAGEGRVGAGWSNLLLWSAIVVAILQAVVGIAHVDREAIRSEERRVGKEWRSRG